MSLEANRDPGTSPPAVEAIEPLEAEIVDAIAPDADHTAELKPAAAREGAVARFKRAGATLYDQAILWAKRGIAFMREAAIYYWSNRKALEQRFREYLESSEKAEEREREIRLVRGRTYPTATYAEGCWQVQLPDCCVVCGEVAEDPWQEESREVADVTRSLWSPGIGLLAGASLALLLGKWMLPLGVAAGFAGGYLLRSSLRVELRLKRCNAHSGSTADPQLYGYAEHLIVRTGHKAVVAEFVQANRPRRDSRAFRAGPPSAPEAISAIVSDTPIPLATEDIASPPIKPLPSIAPAPSEDAYPLTEPSIAGIPAASREAPAPGLATTPNHPSVAAIPSWQQDRRLADAIAELTSHVTIMPQCIHVANTGGDGPVMQAALRLKELHEAYPDCAELHYLYAAALQLALQEESAGHVLQDCVAKHPECWIAVETQRQIALHAWNPFLLPEFAAQAGEPVHDFIHATVRTNLMLAVRDGATARAVLFLRDAAGEFDAERLAACPIDFTATISPVGQPQVVAISYRILDDPSNPFRGEVTDCPVRPFGHRERLPFELFARQETFDFVILDAAGKVKHRRRISSGKSMAATQRKLIELLAAEGPELSTDQVIATIRRHQAQSDPQQIRYDGPSLEATPAIAAPADAAGYELSSKTSTDTVAASSATASRPSREERLQSLKQMQTVVQLARPDQSQPATCDVCAAQAEFPRALALMGQTANSWIGVTGWWILSHPELRDSPLLIDRAVERQKQLGLKLSGSPETKRMAWLTYMEAKFGASNWLLCQTCAELAAPESEDWDPPSRRPTALQSAKHEASLLVALVGGLILGGVFYFISGQAVDLFLRDNVSGNQEWLTSYLPPAVGTLMGLVFVLGYLRSQVSDDQE